MDNRKMFNKTFRSVELLPVSEFHNNKSYQRPRVCSFTSRRHIYESGKSYTSSAPNIFYTPIKVNGTDNNEIFKKPQAEGKETWSILFMALPFNILLGMLWIAFPIFYIEFSEHFDATKGAAGWIGSLQNGLQQFLGLVTSSPIEIYGCKIVSLVGTVIVFIGIAMSAFAPNIFYLYCSYGIITGIGLSMANLCCQVIVQQHFNRNRSLATAIAMIGKSIGQVLGPITIQFLIDVYGWRGALIVFSAIFLNTFALSFGFRPPNNYEKKARGLKEVLKKIVDFSMFSDLIFLLFCLSFVLFKFNNMAFFRQLPSRMVYEGMDRHSAAFVLSIAAACSIIGRFMSGIIGNVKCVNRTLFYALSLFMTGIVTCSLVFSVSFIYTSVLSGLNGISTGTATLMANVVIVDLFGAENIARSKGLFNVCSAIAGFLATPTTGWIFDITGNYNLPFIVVGIMSISGGVLALLVYFMHKQSMEKAKNAT